MSTVILLFKAAVLVGVKRRLSVVLICKTTLMANDVEALSMDCQDIHLSSWRNADSYPWPVLHLI